MSAEPNGASLLFLIGPRGSGKTTVARLLAEQLAWDCVDADAVLEARQGRSIRQLFADEGEAFFRAEEAAVLAELCQRQRCVVAAGGGVVLCEDNRRRLREQAKCVWLTADAATLWRRLQGDATTAQRRPNLTIGGQAEVEELLQVREPLYRACADLIVDTTGRTPDEIARVVLSWWPPS